MTVDQEEIERMNQAYEQMFDVFELNKLNPMMTFGLLVTLVVPRFSAMYEEFGQAHPLQRHSTRGLGLGEAHRYPAPGGAHLDQPGADPPPCRKVLHPVFRIVQPDPRTS